METTKPSQSGVAIKWALISFIAGIIVTFAIQLLGHDPFGPAQYFGDIPFIVFMCMAQVEYRKQLSGKLTYGQGFMEGLLYSVFNGILIAVFLFVYTDILSPEVWSHHLDLQQADFVKAGLSSDQVDASMTMMRKLGVFTPIIGALIGVPIVGMIIALITSAIFKKELTIADIENQQNDPAV